MADSGCLVISGLCQHPSIGDHIEVSTTDRTGIQLIPKSGEDGDKAEPSNPQDGIFQKLEPTSFPAHAPATPDFATADVAGRSSTLTISFNPHLGATVSEGAPSLHQSISVTSLIINALYPATTTRTMDAPPLWRVKARKALEYLTTKHPKVVSAFSIVLVAVGHIASHPGVSACVGGPILAAVQSVGAIAVAVGKWLRKGLDSAAAAPMQAHSQAVGGPSRMSTVAYEVGLEEHHII